MSSDLLRRASDLIEQAVTEATEKGHYYAGVRLIGEEWAALLSLPVAAPLAAWLRAEANCLDSTADVAEHMPKLMDAIEENLTRKPARGHEVRISMSTATDAIAFAKAILGESP